MHIEELSLVAVAGLVLVVAIAMLAGRIGIATPLVLVVVGIVIGYLPGVPLIELDPEIILLGVLPPLLYAAAVGFSALMDRRRAKRGGAFGKLDDDEASVIDAPTPVDEPAPLDGTAPAESTHAANGRRFDDVT